MFLIDISRGEKEVMRYALIIAGGAGTRLWPMSTKNLPKQLIPFIDGKSLLEIAMQRLEGLLPPEQIFICAGLAHREVMLRNLPGMTPERFIGEPMGRDTLNAIGLGTAVLSRNDPDATVAVFTADHIIEPVDEFQYIVEHGFNIAQSMPDTLVTFGIAPTHPATGYGYLELGKPIDGSDAFMLDRFKEKPDMGIAQQYIAAGPQKYLWNSGMFVWQSKTLLNCIRKYAPDNHTGLMKIVEAWDSEQRRTVLEQIYPTLKKISVDFAVMEPASMDSDMQVAAVPMSIKWIDVGSWPSFGLTRDKDDQGNTVSGCEALFMGCENTLVVSNNDEHLVAGIGCKDMILIHTDKVTLICRADQAEQIKQLHAMVGQKYGEALL